MLTRELIRFQRRNGLRPSFVAIDREENLKLAADLIGTHKSGFESAMRRGELEELTDVLIQGANDRNFAAGLEKLLLDHTSFEPVRELDYPALRWELFTFAAEQLKECGGDFDRYRERLLEKENLRDFLAADIYGDLPDNERVTGFRELYPRELLRRYNVALVQGFLMYAEEVVFEVADAKPAELRRLFKYLRFFRLLAEVKRLPASRHPGKTALRLAVSGPFAIFANSRKYALQLATFFPAVVNLELWELKAKIRMGAVKGDLKLDQTCGLESHYKNFSSYVPEEVRMFHRLFKTEVAEWRIVGETPFLNGGGQEVIFPDLSFERTADGRVLHLELFHRWHHGQLERRLELLARKPELPLILGIDRALASDEAFEELKMKYPALVNRIYRFRDFPGVDRTRRVLDAASADLSS